MNTQHSTLKGSTKTGSTKVAPLAFAASLLIAASMAPGAYAAEAGAKAGPGYFSTIRKLIKKPSTTTKYASPARSPFICTFSGLGKKGGCFLRAGYQVR